jgi:hypothetical protein
MTTETKAAEKQAETKIEERREAQPPARTEDREAPAPPALTDQSRGVQLITIEDFYRFGKYVHASGLAPKGLDTAEGCMIALQMGAEVGLPPMAAIQNIAVINGRPSVWGDAFLALLKNSPFWDESEFEEAIFEDAKHGTVAKCKMRRKGGKPKTTYFSQRMAERARLWTKEGPWRNFPERMLQMRARAWNGRDLFPDVLRGLSVAEEIIDVEFEKVEDAGPIMEPRAMGELHPVPEGDDAAAPRPNGNGNGKARRMKAKYPGKCGSCDTPIALGDEIVYDPADKSAYCPGCYNMEG